MPSYNIDKLLTVTKALPAAAANHNSGTLDLGCATPYPAIRKVALKLNVPALTALVDAKTVTIKVQDSADDSSYADVAGLDSLVLTGAGGAGCAAAEKVWNLPDAIRRYVQVNIAVLTAGGDNTAKSITLALVK